tara:strand:+ start:956 stop:1153 length:198 start_codon:yes stop_codon:yes gene_type:complete
MALEKISCRVVREEMYRGSSEGVGGIAKRRELKGSYTSRNTRLTSITFISLLIGRAAYKLIIVQV